VTELQRTRNWLPWLFSISAIVVILDRLTKLWVSHHIPVGGAIPVIPRVFRITHVLNSGAAFSLFEDSASPQYVRRFLIGFSLLAGILVLAALFRLRHHFTTMSVALALILGGAIGNVYDRIRFSYVIDFLEVHIIHYHWPDFNVADSAIVIGGCLLLLDAFRTKHE
jgi:signal peptidase II